MSHMEEFPWTHHMDQVPWVNRREPFDLILGWAAKLLVYTDLAETLFLEESHYLLPEGAHTACITPENFIRLGSERISDVLGVLRFEAYRDGELRSPELLRLLARIGTPELFISIDPSGKREVEHWPEPDWMATRKDLLYSYLLAKLVYLELKAQLQNRPITPEELASFTDAASALVPFAKATPSSVDEVKLQLIECWQRCPWEPPNITPGSRRPLLKRCWSSVLSLLRFTRRR